MKSKLIIVSILVTIVSSIGYLVWVGLRWLWESAKGFSWTPVVIILVIGVLVFLLWKLIKRAPNNSETEKKPTKSGKDKVGLIWKLSGVMLGVILWVMIPLWIGTAIYRNLFPVNNTIPKANVRGTVSTSRTRGVISLKPDSSAIIGPMNDLHRLMEESQKQKKSRSKKVITAPVNNWSNSIYLPHNGRYTRLEFPDGSRISVLWNGQIEEELPVPEGIKSKMPVSVLFLQLKSRGPNAVPITVESM